MNWYYMFADCHPNTYPYNENSYGLDNAVYWLAAYAVPTDSWSVRNKTEKIANQVWC